MNNTRMVKMVGKEKLENYLKAILKIQTIYGSVRGIDISRELDVSKPTVSVAVHELEKEGYVDCINSSNIILTKKGAELANKIKSKYCFFLSMLRYLGVEDKKAKNDACKMEHSVSDESYQALYKFFSCYLEREEDLQQTDIGMKDYFF